MATQQQIPTYDGEEAAKRVYHPGRHRIQIQNTQKKDTHSTQSPNMNSQAHGTDYDAQPTLDENHNINPSMGTTAIGGLRRGHQADALRSHSYERAVRRPQRGVEAQRMG